MCRSRFAATITYAFTAVVFIFCEGLVCDSDEVVSSGRISTLTMILDFNYL